VLYVHAEIKDTDFIEPLVCALRQVLTTGVNVKDIRLPLDPALRATPNQFDVGKVSDQFARATAFDGGSLTYKYLLVPYDLKDQTHRYVFATTFPHERNGVVSLLRLYATNPAASRHERAVLTALRAYKFILKSIARLAGLTSSNGCILAFPRGLDELDAKSSEFCSDDHALLVDSGLLKAEESGGCAFISQIAPDHTEKPALQAPHIRNTPNFVSGIGALSVAEKHSASTRRVSAGAMMPSSQTRAVA
jgi:predicted Zn-dependent protease